MTNAFLASGKEKLPNFTVDHPHIPHTSINIVDYGAVGDGLHNNTKAINQAIEDCSNRGGGTVVIPAGIWLTGPIQLKSKINLHVSAGSLVVFTSDFEDYPLIQSSFEGEPAVRCQSPIDGEGLDDVAITGDGIFDGSGGSWRPVKKWKMTEKQWDKLIQSGGSVDEENQIWWPTENAKNGKLLLNELKIKKVIQIDDYLPLRSYLRPNLLSLRKCKRIRIDGPTFQNSPAWNLHPWLSQHITIQNVTVRNPWYAQNGDGLDLESCRYAIVKDCLFDVGDDAICLKSGKNEAGRQIGVPSEDILIEHCRVYSGHGGIVIGSEMSGDVRNIHIRDCLFSGTDKGIRFKTVRGRGGTVENIVIERIQMDGIEKEAIIFQMYYETDQIDETEQPITEETPIFRNVLMKDITCRDAGTAVILKGLPEMPIEGLTFKNITIESIQGIDASHTRDIYLNNLVCSVKEGPLVVLNNCNHVAIDTCTNKKHIDSFLRISGKNMKQVECTNIDVDVENMVVVGDGVDRDLVSFKD